MKTLNLFAIGMGLLTAVSLGSCTKNETGQEPIDPSTTQNQGGTAGKSNLQIRMKDAPADLDSVVVDIQQVRVLMAYDSLSTDTGWISLATNAGLYDLLSFQNGIDTAIANGTVPTDTLKQIRFILGSNNYVVDTAGVTHPLIIPSGAESGLKVNLSRVMGATWNTVVIDFDAAASVHRQGRSGPYMLRPVLIVQ